MSILVLRIYSITLKSLCSLLTFYFLSSFSVGFIEKAQAATIFEGYYRIILEKKHIGYIIQRYSFDKKAKTYQSIYYIRTNSLGGNLTESLRASTSEDFRPISYQFTSSSGAGAKTIDAKFQGLLMNATISNGKTSQKFKKTFAKGTFLSTFLGYLILQKGMATDKRYIYSGIAEEDGEAYKGDAYIKKNMEAYKGKKLFKILNIFKGTKFISYVNERGEIYATKSPAQKISTELVHQPIEATQGFQLNTQHLKTLFGSVPRGQMNSFSSVSTPASKPPAQKKPVKIGRPSNKSPKK